MLYISRITKFPLQTFLIFPSGFFQLMFMIIQERNVFFVDLMHFWQNLAVLKNQKQQFKLAQLNISFEINDSKKNRKSNLKLNLARELQCPEPSTYSDQSYSCLWTESQVFPYLTWKKGQDLCHTCNNRSCNIILIISR